MLRHLLSTTRAFLFSDVQRAQLRFVSYEDLPLAQGTMFYSEWPDRTAIESIQGCDKPTPDYVRIAPTLTGYGLSFFVAKDDDGVDVCVITPSDGKDGVFVSPSIFDRFKRKALAMKKKTVGYVLAEYRGRTYQAYKLPL